jgi:putative ABC transport system ATP-binding protein
MSEVLLRTEALTKVFGWGNTIVRAVDDVSLEVREGEMVLIMGPSGSGKTTLLTMLGGLLKPTSGRVTIAGQEITALRGADLVEVHRHLVGFIFQSFNLLENLSVSENIEVVLNIAGVTGERARNRAAELLEDRGLTGRAQFRTKDLSGGEKQRLSIARALANNPRLILGDEPTANLESRHGRDVMRVLRDTARSEGRAVVVVSHDHRIREVADRVLWLEDGRPTGMERLVVDPVCGMSLTESVAKVLEGAGVTYYFCSTGCLKEFQESPAAAKAS